MYLEDHTDTLKSTLGLKKIMWADNVQKTQMIQSDK